MYPIQLMKMCVLAFAGLLLFYSQLPAQPVRDRILGDTEITGEHECAKIQVKFNFPIQYISHFPHKPGGELRIQLAPIAINPFDIDALFKRESFIPKPDNPARLSEVIYEGDIEGGPFLTLLFSDPLLFKVEQGPDYRSLNIVVSTPEATEPCTPEP